MMLFLKFRKPETVAREMKELCRKGKHRKAVDILESLDITKRHGICKAWGGLCGIYTNPVHCYTSRPDSGFYLSCKGFPEEHLSGHSDLKKVLLSSDRLYTSIVPASISMTRLLLPDMSTEELLKMQMRILDVSHYGDYCDLKRSSAAAVYLIRNEVGMCLERGGNEVRDAINRVLGGKNDYGMTYLFGWTHDQFGPELTLRLIDYSGKWYYSEDFLSRHAAERTRECFINGMLGIIEKNLRTAEDMGFNLIMSLIAMRGYDFCSQSPKILKAAAYALEHSVKEHKVGNRISWGSASPIFPADKRILSGILEDIGYIETLSLLAAQEKEVAEWVLTAPAGKQTGKYPKNAALGLLSELFRRYATERLETGMAVREIMESFEREMLSVRLDKAVSDELIIKSRIAVNIARRCGIADDESAATISERLVESIFHKSEWITDFSPGGWAEVSAYTEEIYEVTERVQPICMWQERENAMKMLEALGEPSLPGLMEEMHGSMVSEKTLGRGIRLLERMLPGISDEKTRIEAEETLAWAKKKRHDLDLEPDKKEPYARKRTELRL